MIQVSLPHMSLSHTILPEIYYVNVNNVLFLFKFSMEKKYMDEDDFSRILGFSHSTILKLSFEREGFVPVISHWSSVNKIPFLAYQTKLHPSTHCTCVLYSTFKMHSNNYITQKETPMCLLKFLAHGLLKQSHRNIYSLLKRSKKIVSEEARNIMLFASHLTKTA